MIESVDAIEADLRALGVRRGVVLEVHTSFRAVGPVEGGPLGLLAALRRAIGEEGTLVMPTMTDGESVFDPRETPSVDMGITAELFRQQPGVVRSTHPGGSFAAEGPLAERICAPQPLAPPHGVESPPGRVHALGGQVLLLGVRHSENTVLHVAESIARVPYAVVHPCVVGIDPVTQAPRTVGIPETDHCCRGFDAMDAWLRARHLQRDGSVGRATSRLVLARDLVTVAVEALSRDPLVFLCAPDAGCGECDRARASVTRPEPSELPVRDV